MHTAERGGEEEPLLGSGSHAPLVVALGMSRTQLFGIVFALALVFAIASLDEAMAAVSAVSIVSQFKAFHLFGWVEISYFVTLNASQPLYAKLSDVFGRKPIIIFGVTSLLIGSAGSAWATSMPMFLVARCFAGLGSGGLGGMAFVVIADLVPLDDRPRYQAFLSLLGGSAFFCGPALGGYLTTHYGWRWCYWINLPLCFVTLITVLVLLRLPRKHVDLAAGLKKVDFPGAFTLMLAITAFVIPTSLGGHVFAWGSPIILGLLAFSLLSACAFAVIERKYAAEPIVPPEMFKNKNLLAAWATLFFYHIAFVTLFFYLPVWGQIVEGKSVQETGVQLVPVVGGLVLGGFLYAPLRFLTSKIVTGYSPRIVLLRTGATMLILGMTLQSTVTRSTPKGLVIFYLLIFGVGSGVTLQTSFLSAQAAVEHKDLAMANSLAVFFQNSGGPFGILFVSTVNRLNLTERFLRIPNDIINSDLLRSILKDPSLVHQPDVLTPSQREIVVDQFAGSISYTFRITIIFTIVTLIVGYTINDPAFRRR